MLFRSQEEEEKVEEEVEKVVEGQFLVRRGTWWEQDKGPDKGVIKSVRCRASSGE